ncbi:YsnF/AvaK domain-containing protein [Dyadobacter bucti]|uniref:YsnF/AvaK domain-containing protein n=1 Tax=Dyadobacter bucti TaxID=2572203 RepID=UPI001108D46F|nr:YsnF/AvaK domain-containing protein [Dyadobacter bucti]
MTEPESKSGGESPTGKQKLILPVIEEILVTGKTGVETGKVIISKHVTEETVSVDAGVTHANVSVERKLINQYVETAPPAVRQEGEVTIISVIKEVLVVEKKLMLVEELHVTRQSSHYENIVSHTLRKEQVTVSRDVPGTDI